MSCAEVQEFIDQVNFNVTKHGKECYDLQVKCYAINFNIKLMGSNHWLCSAATFVKNIR